MNPISITKTFTSLLVSAGAGAVVSNAIKMSTPKNARLFQKFTIGLGGFVLSGMVGEMAGQYTNNQIDAFTKAFSSAKKTVVTEVSEPKEPEPQEG